MKKALFAAVATSLFFIAACGNNNGTTAEGKENNESKEQKEAVKIPANFTQYDGPHFTMSYPNDMHSTFDSDETINYSNEDGSMKFDASFSASGTHKNQLKEAGENYPDFDYAPPVHRVRARMRTYPSRSGRIICC